LVDFSADPVRLKDETAATNHPAREPHHLLSFQISLGRRPNSRNVLWPARL